MSVDANNAPNIDDSDADIEDEPVDEFHDIEKPWDPESIRVATKHFSLRNMLDLINDDTLDLAPDFQRRMVWGSVQKAQLIESILLQIPLPAFYFAEDSTGALQVVDGVQRLSTIHDFVAGGPAGRGGFKLEGLEYLRDVKGKRFSDLPPIWKRRIHNTQIVAHVIAPTTPPNVMYDIFRRINTGGTPLNPQEIRHCISKPRSRDFVKRLVSLPQFEIATLGKLHEHKRMIDREVALRFVAFWNIGYEHYLEGDNDGTLNGFLLNAVRRLDDSSLISDPELEDIVVAFERGLANAHQVFGVHAFRKWPLGDVGKQAFPFNRALFETWSTQLARVSSLNSTGARRIQENARRAFSEDRAYVDAVSSSTGDPRRVRARFERTREIIEQALI